MISSLYVAQLERLNNAYNAAKFGHDILHSTPLVFLVKDEPMIVEFARRLGADVEDVERASHSVKFKDGIRTEHVEKATLLSFSSELQKRITATHYARGDIPILKEGYFQKRFEMMNGF